MAYLIQYNTTDVTSGTGTAYRFLVGFVLFNLYLSVQCFADHICLREILLLIVTSRYNRQTSDASVISI
jgi:hypothetical protein